MDAKLQTLLDEVFLETHGEHLADTIAARLVRAAAQFHDTPAAFQEDVREWEFEGSGDMLDTVALGSLPNLREVLSVFVWSAGNSTPVAATPTTLTKLLDASQDGCNGSVKYTRVGDLLRISSPKPISFISVVGVHPPSPTIDNFDTWLYPKHKHWLVQLGIAITQDAVGDDSKTLSLQLAVDAKRTLIASLPKYEG